MTNNSFENQQREAIRRMREMNKRSTNPTAPPPKPEPQPEATAPQKTDNSFLGGLSLPFLQNLKKDGDLTLILGILLLLLSEKADKRLLFALIYILL